MPPSTPFRPPRSARAPALESALGGKRAPQDSPQAASNSAYATISSGAAASPGAARVDKLKDECEQLMMQLGCGHLLPLSGPIENSLLTLHRLPVVCSGANPDRLYVSGGDDRLFSCESVRIDAVTLPFVFFRRRVAAHEKAQREVRSRRPFFGCQQANQLLFSPQYEEQKARLLGPLARRRRT